MGIRDIKEHLSKSILQGLVVITDRGVPISVNLPYPDLLELVDIIDELGDLGALATVQEGRRAVNEGVKGIPVARLFSRVMKLSKSEK